MNDNKKIYNDRIADSRQQEIELVGILPKNMGAYRIFKATRLISLIFFTLVAFLFALTFIKNVTIYNITRNLYYPYVMAAIASFAFISLLFAYIVKIIFLRKAPFDDWCFEISQKRLGTNIIFYDSKYIYIEYDRAGKEVDKREFVSEMSDKSVNYSYFYVKTFVDRGFIQVECTKRQPIPKMAAFSEKDDKYWNIIPVGLTIHQVNMNVAPIGWYLNDQNINEETVETVPSTSCLIAGSTGCISNSSYVIMYSNIVGIENNI